MRALITGSGRGIGAAIADALAGMGHPVIINYRTNERTAGAVKARIEAAGGEAQLARFDVSDAEQTSRSLKDLLAEDRPIGIVVNNAGVADDAPFPAMTHAAWTRVTRTSLDGFFNVTQPLLMPMIQRRWGRIITISSVSGVIGNRGQANYSAAKAGLIGASRSLAKEVAKRKITVNCVAPGLIDTDMIKDAPTEEIIKHIPMRRLGTAAEVAKLVAFLTSDDAEYITGQVIGINGGLA